MIEEQEIHLRDYLKVLRKRRITIITVFLVIFALAVIKTFTATPLYEAATKVLIEKTDPEQALLNYSLSTYDNDFLETQAQIIKSSAVAGKVVDLLQLEKTYGLFMEQHSSRGPVTKVIGWGKGFLATVSDMMGVGDSEASVISETDADAAFRDTLAELVSKELSISPVSDTRIVDISFTSPNPELAALITNSVANAYIEQILDMRMESSGYSISWMTKKAEEERSKLEASEKALQEYMNTHDIVTVEDRITILPQKLTEFNSQLMAAQAERKTLETVYLKVQEASQGAGDPETIPIIAENEALQSLNQQILQAQQHIMELSKKYGPKHPLMKNANSDLEMLTDNRAQELDRIIKTIENDYELAKAKEDNINSLLSKTKSETAGLNERFVQYNILKREVETRRNMYDALVSKINEQSVTEQIQTVNVWVLEEAKVPGSPSKPNKKRNLLLGIVLGLFGGIGLALFLEYLDNTVKVPEDVEAQFGVPALGLIPLEKERLKSDDNFEFDETPGAFQESYRSLYSSIQLSANEAPPKSLLVTSASPQEGKTTTAIHLAGAISRSGKKVLLIDADMRRPRIHKIFNVQNDKGLSTSMAGASDMKIIKRSGLENLDIIPSGPMPPNPAELLGSDRFQSTIKLLSEKYHTVIIDSPPLLSVMDGFHVSKVVDGTIMIARSAKTTYDALYKSLKQLSDISTKILGIVVNGADLKNSYYQYYNYYHYYSSENED